MKTARLQKRHLERLWKLVEPRILMSRWLDMVTRAFIDMVEQVSLGPYLEMFARRNRLGWHTWGNECLNHIELDTPSTTLY